MTHSLSPSSSAPTICPPAVGKKNRRFSLIRLFNGSSNSSTRKGSVDSTFSSDVDPSSTSQGPTPVSTSSSASSSPAQYRHSMMNVDTTTTTMQEDMLRERRKSIAALTDSTTFRSMSLDLKPTSSASSSSFRSSLSRRHSHLPAPKGEMTEKMRQFDELLYQRHGSTIRLTLTPSLLQEP